MSSADAGSDLPIQEAIAEPTEKMVSQTEVNKAIHAAKMHEREKAEARIAQMQQAASGNITPQAAAPYDEEAIINKATERMKAELEEQAYRTQVDSFARNYLDKMKQGPTLYEDFEEITRDVSPKEFPQAAIFAGRMDNTAAIMYELAKNPQKLVQLEALARMSPGLAEKEMTKLSQSIKQNEQAIASNQKSPSPLSKIKSSAMAGRDTGKRTVKDLRKDPRFKG